MRRRLHGGELAADFSEARGAEGGDVEEAPAVEGEEANFCNGGMGGRVVLILAGGDAHGWWCW